MARKLVAAFLILLLFGFQAKKLYSYLSCKASNISNNTSKCDCEKQVNDASNNEQQPNGPKTISIEKTDELFAGCSSLMPIGMEWTLLKNFDLPLRNCCLPAGFNSSVFQPPDLA